MRLAQAQPQPDFTIPSPTPQAQPAPRTAPRTEAPAGPSPFSTLTRGPTTTEISLGIGVLLVLAVVFLFVRQGVRTHLIGRRAALDAADGASWVLFSALMLTATTLVVATIGGLWDQWIGIAGALFVCAVLFVVFAVLFLRAPGRRR